jgi:hypothetical protein
LKPITESHIEEFALEELGKLGWAMLKPKLMIGEVRVGV